jgi:hypothetical protein
MQPTYWYKSAAFLAAGCIVVMVSKVVLKKKIRRKPIPVQGHTRIELSKSEQLYAFMLPPVSFITIFDGELPISYLEAKTKEIIKQNPWLRSRLFYDNDSKIVAVYKEKWNTEEDVYFQLKSSPDLKYQGDYKSTVANVEKYLCAKGQRLVDHDERLFKVTLIEVEPEKKYALLISLSRVLGDAFTCYELYSMLDKSVDPFGMDPTRPIGFDDLSSQLAPLFTEILRHPLLVISVVKSLIFGRRPLATVYELSVTKVNAFKSMLNTNDTDYISSNDIIMAWFAHSCRSDYVQMAYNLRMKFAGYSEQMAGNACVPLMYNKHNYSTPRDVRETVRNFRPKTLARVTCAEIWKFNMAAVTNVSTFYRELDLDPSVSVVAHLPVTVVGDDSFMRDKLTIFRFNKDRVGLLFFTRSLTEAFLDSDVENEDGILSTKLV